MQGLGDWLALLRKVLAVGHEIFPVFIRKRIATEQHFEKCKPRTKCSARPFETSRRMCREVAPERREITLSHIAELVHPREDDVYIVFDVLELAGNQQEILVVQ